MNKHLTVKKNLHRSYKDARKNRSVARSQQFPGKNIPAFIKPFNPYPDFYRTLKTRWGLLAKVDPIHYW